MTMVYFRYRNGNYLVTRPSRHDMVKRCFRINEDFKPEFPDSIDLKISGRCSTGCPYCHEDSDKKGKLANYDDLVSHLSALPEKAGIEIAIGGGNILEDDESKELFIKLVRFLDNKNKLISVTINEKEVTQENIKFLITIKKEKNIEGKEDGFMESYVDLNIGISLGPTITLDRIDEINNIIQSQIYYSYDSSIVFHIILGLFPIDTLRSLLESSNNLKILLLGYKQFGRAEGTKLPESIKKFEILIKEFILRENMDRENLDTFYDHLTKRTVLGFDNLAIEQLNLEKAMLESEFNRIYLGKEFSCSMYIDGVEGKYAKSSTEPKENRVDWNSCDIITYFNHDKGKE